jgi:hypothetical protein
MYRWLPVLLIVAVCVSAYLMNRGMVDAAVADTDRPLVHNVFFTLHDSTPETRQKLVDLCKKYLTKHPGEVYFAAGPLVEELKREVNDRDFDVCLTIVFKNKAAHERIARPIALPQASSG